MQLCISRVSDAVNRVLRGGRVGTQFTFVGLAKQPPARTAEAKGSERHCRVGIIELKGNNTREASTSRRSEQTKFRASGKFKWGTEEDGEG